MEVETPILPNSLLHLMLHLNSQTNILCLEKLLETPSLVCLLSRPQGFKLTIVDVLNIGNLDTDKEEKPLM